MARLPSRTPFVILGLLTTEPMSGYDLKMNIDRSIGQFWNESYGQLYPALKKLHESGLVSKEEDSTGDRKKFVYSITDAGRFELQGWLSEPVAPRNVRNEMLLKLFFGRHMEKETLIGHLRQEIGKARGAAEGLAAARAHLSREFEDEPDLDYWLLTLDLGLRTATVRAEWAEDAIAALTDGTQEN